VKFKQVTMIEVDEWDDLVEETYGRPYSFQQQDECKERGTHKITVPMAYPEDYENESVPEIINGKEMGVSFLAWLERDPAQKVIEHGYDGTDLFWQRNFYPHVDMIAQGLYVKGLLPAGDYVINIDW